MKQFRASGFFLQKDPDFSQLQQRHLNSNCNLQCCLKKLLHNLARSSKTISHSSIHLVETLLFHIPDIFLEILQSLSPHFWGKKCIWQSQVFTKWWTRFCCRATPVVARASTGEDVTFTCIAQGLAPGRGIKN